jgi:hypothetical protein
MPGHFKETVLITLMHEVRSFVRQNMEQPEVMAELRNFFAEKRGPMPRPAEIVRAFELLAPGLMVDFLEAHPEIVNRYALRLWAAQREELHAPLVDMTV